MKNKVGLILGYSIAFFGLNSALAEPYDCNGRIDNDEIAAYCEGFERDPQLTLLGSRFVYHTFEDVTRSLTDEIEQDYDMILMINSADPDHANSSNGLIPAQHMMVVKKGWGNNRIFSRSFDGSVSGVLPGTNMLDDIIGTSYLNQIGTHGAPYYDGELQLIPVSTGASHYMLSFSGIFQVNYGRSKSLNNHYRATNWNAPMSNALYLGYYYGTDTHRERISYAAVHGTPPGNWSLLGRSRASHGCTRVHPEIAVELFDYVKGMGRKNIFEFDWDFELPVQDPVTPYANRKPFLIMIFNGYESQDI